MKPIVLAGLLMVSALGARLAWAADTAPAPRKVAVVALTNPRSLAADKDGNVYVADDDGGKVVKLTPAGVVSVLGGAGASQVTDPLGIAVGKDGTVFVADTSGNMVWKIPPGGATVAAVKGEAVAGVDFKSPTGVTVDSAGNAYVTNNGDNTILKITPAGALSVFAGTSGNSGTADGTGSAASFVTPRGIGIDGKDNLYVADEGASNIRKITPAGVVTTLAGKAGTTGSTDGTGTVATFGAPRSVTAAADGTVYVADTDNAVVRKVTPEGVVTTLAGKAGDASFADGKGAAARFSEPRGIGVDGAGNVYVADTGNACVRQVTPDGVVTTITAVPAETKPATATKP